MTATIHAISTYGAAAQSGAVHVSEPLKKSGVIPFTARGARLHTDRTYANLEAAYDGVVEAYDRQAWRVCPRYDDPDVQGYDSWGDYLEAEFGDLRVIKLDSEQAATLIQVCREQDMSYRQIARMLGMSVGKVHKADPTAGTEGETVGDDGKRRAKSTGRKVPEIEKADEQAERRAFIQIVIAVVKSAGDEGVTSADVQKTLKEGHQRVSAALSRAARSQRVRYEAPEKRGLFGRYFGSDEVNATE